MIWHSSTPSTAPADHLWETACVYYRLLIWEGLL